MSNWFVYLLECQDNSVYCGITDNVERRMAVHAAGKGARYTRSRPPKKLLGCCRCDSRSAALKLEIAIKKLKPAAKRELAASWSSD
ncbi:GIY-YIG nuclease family protein [Permianibacter aggregans]|uniref:Putative endonuclease n=1 Tax=Permianibacter aggregans TaxID=1510150 RepID=A0A4R6UGY8_9GAMM|nr:GIY-YIG nuclease family protein [Permianibacter aggregans]QGX41150.1 GIY-YIG nuclease family protein [Permianibacter aggregans]TDQ44539.1 putative endonuclease [Permianibacter aggregans]